MRTRWIGAVEVTTAGLGCGKFGAFLDAHEVQPLVDAALDAGVRHFDTADVYGEGLSETLLGQALGSRRAEVIITTKFGAEVPADGSRPGSASWATRACDASLARLGTDWIDVYLFHNPDPTTPIIETLEALGKLQAAGKVREIGCSNFSPEQVSDASSAAAELGIAGFRTVQNSYSLLDRTAESSLIPTCTPLGVSIMPYRPLASGLLAGRYRRGEPLPEGSHLAHSLRGVVVRDYFPALLIDECFDVVEALDDYARQHGHTLPEMALSWLVSKPYVASVISGAGSPDQVRANVEALTSWNLGEQQQADIAALSRDDVAFTWDAGFPAYSRPPQSVDESSVPNVRRQEEGA